METKAQEEFAQIQAEDKANPLWIDNDRVVLYAQKKNLAKQEIENNQIEEQERIMSEQQESRENFLLEIESKGFTREFSLEDFEKIYEEKKEFLGLIKRFEKDERWVLLNINWEKINNDWYLIDANWNLIEKDIEKAEKFEKIEYNHVKRYYNAETKEIDFFEKYNSYYK